MSDATDLIDRSIADLQELAAELATELEKTRPVPGKSPRHLRRKETLLAISILLPKLAEVRRLEPQSHPGGERLRNE